MYRFYCETCRLVFESALPVRRCGALACQSKAVKEITGTFKGVSYSNFDTCYDLEGAKTDRLRYLQSGVISRHVTELNAEEEEDAQNNAE